MSRPLLSSLKCWWSKCFKPKPYRTSLLLSGKKITPVLSFNTAKHNIHKLCATVACMVCVCVTCAPCSIAFSLWQWRYLFCILLHSLPHYLHGSGCIWVPPHHWLYRSHLCCLGVQQGSQITWATSALSTLLRFALDFVAVHPQQAVAYRHKVWPIFVCPIQYMYIICKLSLPFPANCLLKGVHPYVNTPNRHFCWPLPPDGLYMCESVAPTWCMKPCSGGWLSRTNESVVLNCNCSNDQQTLVFRLVTLLTLWILVHCWFLACTYLFNSHQTYIASSPSPVPPPSMYS